MLNIFLEKQGLRSQRERRGTGPKHPAPRSAQGWRTPETRRMFPEGLGLQEEERGWPDSGLSGPTWLFKIQKTTPHMISLVNPLPPSR